ncbi:MAG: hypothetical protein ABIK15_05595 [Pseudomonadota bacterium]
MKKAPDTNPFTQITKQLRAMISSTAVEVSQTFFQHLAAQESAYLAHAVWGGTENYVLDNTQLAIHLRMGNLKKEIMRIIDLENFSEVQGFAIGFLVKEMMINKITLLISIGKVHADKTLFEQLPYANNDNVSIGNA